MVFIDRTTSNPPSRGEAWVDAQWSESPITSSQQEVDTSQWSLLPIFKPMPAMPDGLLKTTFCNLTHVKYELWEPLWSVCWAFSASWSFCGLFAELFLPKKHNLEPLWIVCWAFSINLTQKMCISCGSLCGLFVEHFQFFFWKPFWFLEEFCGLWGMNALDCELGAWIQFLK